MIKVLPSILSADFCELGKATENMEKWHADGIHFDVMDGHFVPNITYGPAVCAAMKKRSSLPMDVHLMVSEPSKWIQPFADAGADIITFHAEAETHIHRTLELIHSFGLKGGLVLNPCTGLDVCRYALPYCDQLLLMTVNPGFGGQKFIPGVLDKARALVQMREEMGLDFEIEVDGGVNEKTAALCREAGVTMLVAGSAVFHAEDPAGMISLLRG